MDLKKVQEIKHKKNDLHHKSSNSFARQIEWIEAAMKRAKVEVQWPSKGVEMAANGRILTCCQHAEIREFLIIFCK